MLRTAIKCLRIRPCGHSPSVVRTVTTEYSIYICCHTCHTCHAVTPVTLSRCHAVTSRSGVAESNAYAFDLADSKKQALRQNGRALRRAGEGAPVESRTKVGGSPQAQDLRAILFHIGERGCCACSGKRTGYILSKGGQHTAPHKKRKKQRRLHLPACFLAQGIRTFYAYKRRLWRPEGIVCRKKAFIPQKSEIYGCKMQGYVL